MPPRKYTDAKRDGNRKWDAANLDRISIALPKGQKDIIKAWAKASTALFQGPSKARWSGIRLDFALY